MVHADRLPYNLYCVGGDVKHCSIQSDGACRIIMMMMISEAGLVRLWEAVLMTYQWLPDFSALTLLAWSSDWQKYNVGNMSYLVMPSYPVSKQVAEEDCCILTHKCTPTFVTRHLFCVDDWLTGEPALEPPSYYYTKPVTVTSADPGASTCHPPPDGAQRFSRRVRGIAAQNDAGNAGPRTETSSAQAPYRMVTKRIYFRRATLPRSVSPWCRSRRRRCRKVIVYVDENGKELSALDMHKRAKAGIPQSTSDTGTKAATDKATKTTRTSSTPASETRSKRLSTAADEAEVS